MGIHHKIGIEDEDRYGCCTALQVGERAFLSGLRVETDDQVESQFQQIVELIERTLGTFQVPLADVVRTRVFYTRCQGRASLRAAHGRFFRSIRPAISLTGVPALGRPSDTLLGLKSRSFSGLLPSDLRGVRTTTWLRPGYLNRLMDKRR